MPSPRKSRLRNLELSDPRLERDGLRLITITSANLRGRGDITVYVPEIARQRRSVPLVILLHGIFGSHWGWALRGGAHRTAARLIARGRIPPMILAMPSDGLAAEGSGYVGYLDGGPDYERWIVDDVPATVAMAEACVDAESSVFIAGLSMGGFGALRLMAKHPGRFRAASGHSSATHLHQLDRYLPVSKDHSGVAEGDRSLLDALLKNRRRLPPFRFDCGRDDFLIGPNRALHQALTDAGVAHEYQEFDGDHTWPYWEKHLADTLLFFAAHCR